MIKFIGFHFILLLLFSFHSGDTMSRLEEVLTRNFIYGSIYIIRSNYSN